MTDDPAGPTEHGLLTASTTMWDLGCVRASIIGPLAAQGAVGHVAADEAAATLGLSRRQVHVLLQRWRAGQGLVSDMIPGRSSGGLGGSRVPVDVEAVMDTVLRRRFLTRQRPTVSSVHLEIARRCRVHGLRSPSRGTVMRRIAALDPVELVSAREGADAARTLRSAGGVPPETTRVLEQVQIDHTVIDVIVVDERHRLPLGRPYLTVGIDVASRSIPGLVVTLDAPSATSVGLCLAHMVSDKRPWLEQLGVQASWPMRGKPARLYVDNGADFHSEALQRGCDEHGIRLDYRPPGQPHYGGVVERVIGTMMSLVHELPGTTFSNVAQRGDYDSGGKASLTLPELQRWLALAVASYHGTVHATLSRTPAGVWAEQTELEQPAAVANPTAFHGGFPAGAAPHADQVRLHHRPRPVLQRRLEAFDRTAGAAGPVRAAPRPTGHLADLGA